MAKRKKGVASNKDRIAARFLIFLFLFKGWFITYVVSKTLLVFNKRLTFWRNKHLAHYERLVHCTPNFM